MSLRNINVQYVGDTLYLPPFEREVKHIVVCNEDVKNWEHFEPKRTCHDRNASAREVGACSSESAHTMISSAHGEKGEMAMVKMVKVEPISWMIEAMNDMYCDGFIDGWNAQSECKIEPKIANIIPWHDGNYYCSACGCIIDPVFDFCSHCGAELDLEYVL